MSGTGFGTGTWMFEGEVQFVVVGSGICFLPDEGGGSTEGVDEAGMVADPEPDWTGWLRTDGGGGGGRRTWRVDPD